MTRSLQTLRLILTATLLTASALAAANDGLPPTPVDRSQPGVASITDDSSGDPVTKKWSIRYNIDRGQLLLACTATYTFNGKAGTTRDFFVPVTPAELGNAASRLTKAQEWSRLTKERNPPPFRKSLGTVDGGEWTFVWNGEKAVVMAQRVSLGEDDWREFSRLIPLADSVMAEQSTLQKSAREFVESLK